MRGSNRPPRIRISCFASRPHDEESRLRQAVALLDFQVHTTLEDDEGRCAVALAAREPIRVRQQHAPRDGAGALTALRLNIDRYPVDDVAKCRLALATRTTGVVGYTENGWIYLRDGRPGVLRPATDAEVLVVPMLCRPWKSFLEEHSSEHFENDRAAFLALLAPYDLRDGHNPGVPFTGARSDLSRGWFGLVKELVEDLLKLGWNREILQIKEKYGTLRFYITQRDEPLLARIGAAREHSAEVCEVCGKGGELRTAAAGWYATRCDSCWPQPL